MSMPEGDWKTWAEDNERELELWKTVEAYARDDIIRYKKHQWQVGYIAFAFYGAIVALSRDQPWLFGLLVGISAFGIAAFAIAVLVDLGSAVERARDKSRAALRRFEPDIAQLDREYDRADIHDPLGRLTRSLVPVIIAVLVLAGAFLTVVLSCAASHP